MKKEFFIFIILLFILSLGMHYKEFFSFPLEHIQNLPNSAAYGIGVLHPLVFTLILYLFISLPRLVFKIFRKKS